MLAKSQMKVGLNSFVVALIVLIIQHNQVQATVDPIGGLLGNVGQVASMGLNSVPNVLNAATNAVGGLTKPVSGVMNTLGQALHGTGINAGLTTSPLTGTLRLANGLLGGATTGLSGGLFDHTLSDQAYGKSVMSGPGALAHAAARSGSVASHLAAQEVAGNVLENSLAGHNYGVGARGASAMGHMIGDAAASAAATTAAYGGSLASGMAGSYGAPNAYGGAMNAAAALGTINAANAYGAAGALGATGGLGSAAQAAAGSFGVTGGPGSVANAIGTANAIDGAAGALSAANGLGVATQAAELGAAAATVGSTAAGSAAAAPVLAGAAAAAAAPVALGATPGQALSRAALAADAIGNAQADAALAGASMAAHGAINAHSASLASNAYRNAKLASARDRVNVAGTIQNSARISDAAIATHDAATKAEDSLMGSELAVDSAATVLDSDAAYIPPVTNSLLRSLPYGRLGIRNILPKPLTYPSTLLPDVWLNGAPVSYLNVPFRALPYGVGPTALTNKLYAGGALLANGGIVNGQPFMSTNGGLIHGTVFDPATAYLATHLNGAVGGSVLPILANGQLEAQDESAMANLVTAQQVGGAGMSATYSGYGRMNPTPMITGSVNENNLFPTTTVGTTYPIGSALVIEPRDSYFQDHVNSASSRNNWDERQQ